MNRNTLIQISSENPNSHIVSEFTGHLRQVNNSPQFPGTSNILNDTISDSNGFLSRRLDRLNLESLTRNFNSSTEQRESLIRSTNLQEDAPIFISRTLSNFEESSLSNFLINTPGFSGDPDAAQRVAHAIYSWNRNLINSVQNNLRDEPSLYSSFIRSIAVNHPTNSLLEFFNAMPVQFLEEMLRLGHENPVILLLITKCTWALVILLTRGIDFRFVSLRSYIRGLVFFVNQAYNNRRAFVNTQINSMWSRVTATLNNQYSRTNEYIVRNTSASFRRLNSYRIPAFTSAALALGGSFLWFFARNREMSRRLLAMALSGLGAATGAAVVAPNPKTFREILINFFDFIFKKKNN